MGQSFEKMYYQHTSIVHADISLSYQKYARQKHNKSRA